MLHKNRSRKVVARNLAIIVAATASVAIAGPAVASAAPGTGSAGSSNTGSAGIDDPLGTLLGALNYIATGSAAGNGQGGAPTNQQCNAQTQSGGSGVTNTVYQLGRSGPTSFVLNYNTYDIPDDIQVFYQGAQLLDTGYVGNNNGTAAIASPVVQVPAGTDTSVLVRVTGPDGTAWDYTVNCPS